MNKTMMILILFTNKFAQKNLDGSERDNDKIMFTSHTNLSYFRTDYHLVYRTLCIVIKSDIFWSFLPFKCMYFLLSSCV